MPRTVGTASVRKNILAALEAASLKDVFLVFIYVWEVSSVVFLLVSLRLGLGEICE